MTAPRLLDLFSCAGGAGMGYHRAGFEVTGVDIVAQPRYPFRHVQADAIEYLRDHGHEYDAIHASPPCQRFSTMTKRHGPDQVDTHPDLVDPTRDLLLALGLPYVIENVVGAPLRSPVMLCGSMFGLAVPGSTWYLKRHRIFESSVTIMAPASCAHVGRAIGVYGSAGGSSRRDGITMASTEEWRVAMGIEWMIGAELAEAIPPAYTAWIGQSLMEAVR